MAERDPLSDLDRNELLHRLDLWNRALARQQAVVSVTVEEAQAMPLDDLRTIARAASRQLASLTGAMAPYRPAR